ncbi:tyrosine--tRNA ligase [Candidatus Pacearchaeota archaeon]|nr:tyrosine--tRNA ligase [Candidatus Pacearchaeota archaeon]
MDSEKRLEFIKRNTIEIISEKELNELLKSKKKPVAYLGTAITGRPHIGYFIWASKLADFIKAGLKVKLLLADIHGALDNTPWNVLEKRYKYYEKVIPLMFKSLSANTKELQIVKGSSFQLKKEYILDLLKMATFISVHDATKSASEIVKLGDNPKLGGLIYPLMQALDEQYLSADIQYGGIDQRKIFVFARESLPKIGYKPRIEIMTPLLPGITGKKMSASDPSSVIDLLDDESAVNHKISNAYCMAGDTENGLIAFLEYVLFTLKKDKGDKLVIERDKQYGGNINFNDIESLKQAFKEKKLHPLDLKKAVAREINILLKPMREKGNELKKLTSQAYS